MVLELVTGGSLLTKLHRPTANGGGGKEGGDGLGRPRHTRSHSSSVLEARTDGGSGARSAPESRRSALSVAETLTIIRDVAEALAYLHPRVIHRDLKPHNILLDDQGRGKLADFGIASLRDPDATQTGTQLSMVNGTPFYMAPEILQSGQITPKCDVYSLAIVAAECLSGERPWAGVTQVFQIVWKVCVANERPTLPTTVPLNVRRLIETCWAQDPRMRPTAEELVVTIDNIMGELQRGS